MHRVAKELESISTSRCQDDGSHRDALAPLAGHTYDAPRTLGKDCDIFVADDCHALCDGVCGSRFALRARCAFGFESNANNRRDIHDQCIVMAGVSARRDDASLDATNCDGNLGKAGDESIWGPNKSDDILVGLAMRLRP